jgi:hypothetical protein
VTGREPETVEAFAVRIGRQLERQLERPVHRREAEAGIRKEIALGRIVVDEEGRVLGRRVDADLALALDSLGALTS